MTSDVPSSNSDQLKNIGRVSLEWLEAVGVHSIEDLRRLGSVEVFRLVKQEGFRPTLNLLYALEGALQNRHWTKLSLETKEELKSAVQGI